MYRNILFLLLLLIWGNNAYTQSNASLGLLPSVNINKKLQRDWSLNFKAESRQALFHDGFAYDYLLTDLSLAAATKTGINTTVAAGYLIRIDGEDVRHRAFQQLSIVRRYTFFRLSHRFSSDQTYQKDGDAEYRLRYRLSSEIPLGGLSVDPSEFFIKLNNEYLNSLTGVEYDLEIRTAAFLGYAITPSNKLELGLDYRIDSFLDGLPRNRFWVSVNFYQSL
jgi:hypothetical protein